MGATLFVHDSRGPFNPSQLLDILNRYPVHTLCAPPTAFRQLTVERYQYEMTSKPPRALLDCVSAGEPLNASAISIWRSMTGGITIRDGYGQSETVMLCGNFPGDRVKPGSMGRATPGATLAIVDDDGLILESHTEGHLALLVEDASSMSDAPHFLAYYVATSMPMVVYYVLS